MNEKKAVLVMGGIAAIIMMVTGYHLGEYVLFIVGSMLGSFGYGFSLSQMKEEME